MIWLNEHHNGSLDAVMPPAACTAAQGVTAYVRRPAQRERPNERFLMGTLRSVKYGVASTDFLLHATTPSQRCPEKQEILASAANIRAEEEQMWAQRQRRQQNHASTSLLGESSWSLHTFHASSNSACC